MKLTIQEVFKEYNYRITEQQMQDALNFFSQDRTELRKLFEFLSWNESDENQRLAIRRIPEIIKPCEYFYLLLPGKHSVEIKNGRTNYFKEIVDKSKWENAAKTLIKIGWPKIDHIIVPMFIWLLDPNWPGSNLIYDFICTLPKPVLVQKTSEILDNPQNYSASDYNDLKEIIEELLGQGGLLSNQ